MKNALLILITVAFGLFSFSLNADLPKGRLIELMRKNKIKKFVRMAGSEETAIKELLAFTLPDTIFNLNKELIWRGTRSGRIGEMDYYVSRKMQAFYWILKIYEGQYRSTKENEFCVFLDDSGNAIWDYRDLDEEKKAYYYKVILPSPTNHKDYFDRLGYLRIHSDPLDQLETAFYKWYDEMKIQGLRVMRQKKAAPIPLSKYRLE